MLSEVVFASASALILGGGTLGIQLLGGGTLIVPARSWPRSCRRRPLTRGRGATIGVTNASAETEHGQDRNEHLRL